jgi:hypothetical protein
MNFRPILRILARIAVVIAGLILVLAWYLYARDYSEYFVERKGSLSSHDIEDAGGDSLLRRSWLTLRSESGLTVECGVLAPHDAGRRFPAIIVLGGKATGKYAIDYAFDISDVIIVAVDYPYDPQESYTLLEFLVDVPAMRGALLDIVPSVMLLADYLHSRADVDTSRIILLGYCFGAPIVPVIVANDRRFGAVGMVYGGGDLHGLIRHNVRRYESALMSEFVAGLAAVLLRPIEPMRYVGNIAPTPLIMINGTEDEQIPRENTELFYAAAGEPKRIVWLESRHMNRRNVELTMRIIAALREELIRVGAIGGI